jgi:RNA polymerase sigma-70 factor (ECF subfamily)
MRQRKPEGAGAVVRELHPGRRADGSAAPATTDADIVAQLRAGERTAAAMLFDRYGNLVERLLWSLLGPETEAEDLLHEVFLRALVGIRDIEDPSRLKSWLTGIAVHTARESIRKRVRRRWLRFVDEVPESPAPRASEEVTEATRCTYDVLSAMGADERVFFCLRFIEGMEMAEIAVACDVSISTAKRRLKDAEKHFLARARRLAALRPWLEEGGRWAAEVEEPARPERSPE